MKTGKLLWAGICACLLAADAAAGARAALTEFTAGLKGLDGHFTQQVYDADGKPKESAKGKVAFSSARRFRWEYLQPYPQLIVADGRTVWVYEPDLQQATRRPQGEEEQRNSPLATLFEPDEIERSFIVRELPPGDGGSEDLQWLQLLPKNDQAEGFRSARLGFGRGGLMRMVIVDAVGQRTEIDFSQWRRNPDFDAGAFRFQPPAGVDVIGEGG